MKAENYFKKNHFVYGISSKFEFGRWAGYIKRFDDMESAEKWLNTEEYDFRERELCSRSKAMKWFNSFNGGIYE